MVDKDTERVLQQQFFDIFIFFYVFFPNDAKVIYLLDFLFAYQNASYLNHVHEP